MVEINEILIDSSEKLRGHMEYLEYQHHIMGAIFYKYLSYTIEKENNKQLFKFNINYKEAFEKENIEFYGNKIKEDSLNNLGYFIKPEDLYPNILAEENILPKLDDAIRKIEFKKTSLNDLFNQINYKELSENEEVKNSFERIIKEINGLSFNKKHYDEIKYLMKFFLKKSYTPNEISILLSKLVSINKNEIENVYDATCGSASTLLFLKDEAKITNYYGQEINKNNYDLARMNMIMHGINPENFEIYNEDSTTKQRNLPAIDVVISHPPFLKKWDANDELLKDERFNTFKKLPPKSKADYAFIETMIYPLSDDG
ncbi:MAG TPA: N-6 DNA methylase, partial [Methanosphaera sp.]|nr:N-6 DNA methylase [Methanosphaera sp.]